MSINQVGEKFDLDKLRIAQHKTKEAVKKIASHCFVGMNETDGIKLIENEFNSYGNIIFWHPPKFRIGKNTTKSFKEASELEICLKSDDLFFIDVGPVFYEHEGDYGETFVMGNSNNLLNLKRASEELFELGKNEFFENRLSGAALYSFLEIEAKKRNFVLNLKTLGHRVGDFPHHLFYRGKLIDAPEMIAPNLWVLEVQIKDPETNLGAFFEDILFKS